jgi:hypothetical protein
MSFTEIMLLDSEGVMFTSELMLIISQLQTKIRKYTENETHVDGQLAVGSAGFSDFRNRDELL